MCKKKTNTKSLLYQSSSEEAAVDGISRIKKAALNALHVAASYGNTWLVKYLIEETGVPVNRYSPKFIKIILKNCRIMVDFDSCSSSISNEPM